MLCYAWNRVEEVKKLNLKGIKGNNFYDLLSLALCNSVSKIIKRGIYKEYIYNNNINNIFIKIIMNLGKKK